MNKRWVFLIGLIYLLATSLVFGQEGIKEWVVRKGDSLIIRVKGIERIAIGDANIADVTVVSEDELLINGRKKGTTTLHVWTSRGERLPYRVRVVEKDFPVKEEVDIEELIFQMRRIEGLEGITIIPIGDTLVLKGQVKTDVDREAAAKIASSWAKEVVNLIEIPVPAPPPAKPFDIKGLERQIREIDGLEGVRLRSIGDTLILKGRVASLEDKEACGKIVAPYTSQVVNLIEVSVPTPPPSLDAKELIGRIKQVDGLEGVELSTIGDTLILTGRVRSQDVKEACAKIVAPYTREIVNLIEVEGVPPPPPPVPPYEGINEIEGLEEVTFTLMGENLILRGAVKDQQDKDKAENLAKAVHPKVINLIEVTSPVQVLVKLQLIEIRRDVLKELGVDWSVTHEDAGVETRLDVVKPEPLSGTFNIGIVRASPEENITKIDLALQLLHKRGELEVLSSPSLVTLNKEEAYINMGGRIPIPVTTIDPAGSRITSIDWVEYGIRLRITPHVDRQENINLVVDSSVSDLDWENEVLGYPALLEKKVTTRINTQHGDTVIISGLIDSKRVERISKVPYLGDIPILGAFFTSKEFREEKTELVVLITPQIVRSGDFEELREEDVVDRETSRALKLKEKVLPTQEKLLPELSTKPDARKIWEGITEEIEDVEFLEPVTEKVVIEEVEDVESLEPETLRMVVQVHPEPGRTRLYVKLKNIDKRTFYVGPGYFVLKTLDGDTNYYSYATYTTTSPFFGRRLGPNREVKGFLVFETDEAPKRLIYDDKSGNKAHWDF